MSTWASCECTTVIAHPGATRSYAIAMTGRRQFLTIVGAGFVIAPAAAWLSGGNGSVPSTEAAGRFSVEKTDAEWRALLAPQAYRVLRGGKTEWAFSSPLNKEKRNGVFACAGCDQPLFSSSAKYDSGTGWPSFWTALEGAVATSIDRAFFMVRIEAHCARCGGHLGHIFPDGPPPTGQRYCMNGAALKFDADT